MPYFLYHFVARTGSLRNSLSPRKKKGGREEKKRLKYAPLPELGRQERGEKRAVGGAFTSGDKRGERRGRLSTSQPPSGRERKEKEGRASPHLSRSMRTGKRGGEKTLLISLLPLLFISSQKKKEGKKEKKYKRRDTLLGKHFN